MPSFALPLRAALRQAPKVILVGEMRDKETIEVALKPQRPATWCFPRSIPRTRPRRLNASSAFSRLLIKTHSQPAGKSFSLYRLQRLIPRLTERTRRSIRTLSSTMRTRDYVEKGETEGKSLLDAMRDGDAEGMQYPDGEIEK